MNLIHEFRLLLCGWLMGALLFLAPKDNPEGIRIVEVVGCWADREIKLRQKKYNGT